MTKSLDRDVIIDAWLQSGLQESLCFPFERLSLVPLTLQFTGL